MSEFDEVRERRKQFLKAAYDLGGPRMGNIVGMEEVAQEMGVQWNVLERNELDAYAAYYGGKGFIKSQADGFGIFSITPDGIDEVEGNRRQEAGSVTNNLSIGEAHGSNINTGVQGNIDMRSSNDFRSIEQQIDRMDDPAEADELRAALNTIRTQIEQDGAIKVGALAKFSDKMQKSGWFTGNLTGLIMRYTVPLY